MVRHGRRSLWLVLVLTLLPVPLAAAGEATQESPGPSWSSSLGLSYVATTGNSETTSAGFDLDIRRTGTLWELTGKLSALRASKNGETSAERTSARGRVRRKLGRRWGMEGGLSAERDVFAGLDLRSVLDIGASATFTLGDRLALDLGLGTTWTHEELTSDGDRDQWGGLVSTDLRWSLSDTASFTHSLDLYPSFTESRAYRVESQAALEAAVNRHLALKLGYEVRYNHLPPEGKRRTDTSTRASLVIRF
jgi:putative salt-induced outer membrane protein